MLYDDMETVAGVELPENSMIVAQIKITEFIGPDGAQQLSLDTSKPIDTMTIIGLTEMAKHHALRRNDERQDP